MAARSASTPEKPALEPVATSQVDLMLKLLKQNEEILERLDAAEEKPSSPQQKKRRQRRTMPSLKSSVQLKEFNENIDPLDIPPFLQSIHPAWLCRAMHKET